MLIPWMIVSLLVTAAVLKMIETALPDLEIDGWVPALMVAAVLPVVGFVLAFATSPLAPFLAGGPWVGWAFRIGMSTLALALAFAAIPGIKASGMATIVASLALAMFHAALGFGLDAVRQVASAAR